MNQAEATNAMNLALGRIFRLMSRPFEAGDVEQYEASRRAALDATEALGLSITPPSLNSHKPGWNFGNLCVE